MKISLPPVNHLEVKKALFVRTYNPSRGQGLYATIFSHTNSILTQETR